MEPTKYRLSVLLVTYNHARYIRQALRGLFSQALAGPIEVVVADDGSQDETLKIVREAEGGDSRFHFTYLDATSNRGISKNYERGFAACSGSFVAVLEGDDYLTSPNKLQRQLDFLESHCECNLCAVNYFVYEEERAQFTVRRPAGPGHVWFSARDLIADNVVGNFSTCMYRREALAALPPSIFDVLFYDWIVNICAGRDGLIGFIEEPLSVYRLHAGGAWSRLSPVEKIRGQLNLLSAYDNLTGGVFAAEFASLASRLRANLVTARLNALKGGLRFHLRRVLPGGLKGLLPG
jgi:glycosyltransferase involved in cell wall biosynthesis